MASSFPGGLDTYATNRADATLSATTHKNDHNDYADAINKIEAELGINPSGSFATVAARLLAGIPVEFSRSGVLTVAAGAGRWPCPFAGVIVGVIAAVGVAPTGAAILVDVNKNGTTIFTTQGNRPSIAIGGFVSALVANMNITAVAVGDRIHVDVDQIGSTVAGSDITVVVLIAPN